MIYGIIAILCLAIITIAFVSSYKSSDKKEDEWTEDDGDFFMYMASKGMIKGEDEDED